jgi:hypothetical protein
MLQCCSSALQALLFALCALSYSPLLFVLFFIDMSLISSSASFPPRRFSMPPFFAVRAAAASVLLVLFFRYNRFSASPVLFFVVSPLSFSISTLPFLCFFSNHSHSYATQKRETRPRAGASLSRENMSAHASFSRLLILRFSFVLIFFLFFLLSLSQRAPNSRFKR